MDTTILNTTDLSNNSALSESITSAMGFLMPLLIVSAISLVVLLAVLIISAIGKHKERAAILQTAEEVKAIRRLLESHYQAKAPLYKPLLTSDLEKDPQASTRS